MVTHALMSSHRARPFHQSRVGALLMLSCAVAAVVVGCGREASDAPTTLSAPAPALVWLDRGGNRVGQIDVPLPVQMVRVSPDGARVAWLDREGRVWVRPVGGGDTVRVNAGAARGFAWRPDSGAMALDATDPASRLQILDLATHNERKLAPSGLALKPSDWSGDGQYLVYEQDGGPKQSDVWLLYLKDEGTPVPQAYSNGADSDGMFSPDSRSLAYVSAPTGRAEVFVQPFPVPGIATRVSVNGGTTPRWSGDGKELFYHAADGMLMAATIDHAPQTMLLSTQALFPLKGALQQASSDGQRFLVLTP